MFDLDETLAHCITENIEKADHIISVKLNTGETVKVFTKKYKLGWSEYKAKSN